MQGSSTVRDWRLFCRKCHYRQRWSLLGMIHDVGGRLRFVECVQPPGRVREWLDAQGPGVREVFREWIGDGSAYWLTPERPLTVTCRRGHLIDAALAHVMGAMDTASGTAAPDKIYLPLSPDLI